MPQDLAAIHAFWNGISGTPLPSIEQKHFENWTTWARQNELQLERQEDLVTQLERFVSQKR
jgi:L-rhamnose isomerase